MNLDIRNTIRQGDCLLVPVTDFALSADAQDVARDQGRLVLLRGEAHGHAHVVEAADARLVEFADGGRYLIVATPAPLRHIDAGGNDTREHDALQLLAGVYKQAYQYTAHQRDLRRVID